MVEEQKVRVDNAMSQILDDIDKAHLRPLQAKMFKCAATCCEDKDASISSVQRCIETCGFQLQSAQKIVQDEINHLQDRLQRCIMTCNDSIRDKIGVGASESEINRYTKEFEGCAKKCVDNHIDILPNTLKKMKEILNRKEFQS